MKIRNILLSVLTSLLFVQRAFAQTITAIPPAFTSATGFIAAVQNIGNWIFVGFMIFAIIFLLYGAFQFMYSKGDPEKTATARRNLIYAMIGLIIAVLSKAMIGAASSILGS